MNKSRTSKLPLPTKKQTTTKRYWFVRKSYGWGWTPATIEGWIALILYLVCIILPFVALDQTSTSEIETVSMWLPYTVVATIALIALCLCTGESPRWSWGKKK